MRTSLRLAVCVGAVVAAMPMTATAKPVARVHYEDEFFENFTVDTCGEPINIDHHVTFEGVFILKAPRHGGWPLVMDNYHAVDTYTNTANGVSATVEHQGLFKDLSIRVDGNLVHFVQIETGRPTVAYGPDGTKLLFDRGRIRAEFTIDTKGTHDESDDELLDFHQSVAGPHPIFDGVAGFCDLLELLR